MSLVALSFIAFTSVACMGSGKSERSVTATVTGALREHTQVPRQGAQTTITDYIIPKDRLAEAMAPTTSEFQRALFTDGVLTFAEYEKAIYANVQCLDDAGLHARAELNSRNVYSVTTDPAELNVLHTALASCESQYTSVVSFFWAVHTAPSVQDYQLATDAMARCLIDAGFKDVPEYPDVHEGLVRQFGWVDDGHGGKVHPDGWWDCILRIRTQYNVPAYSG